MYEFKYVSPTWTTSEDFSVTVTVNAVSLEDIYAAFDDFLRGCGFTLPEDVADCDHLEEGDEGWYCERCGEWRPSTEAGCDCPFDVTELPQMDGSVNDFGQEWPG